MERAYFKSRAEAVAVLRVKRGLSEDDAQRIVKLLFDHAYWRGALDAVAMLGEDDPKTRH